MSNTTSNAASLLRPEEVGPLILQPLSTESVAFAVSTVVNTRSNSYRIPVLTGDPDVEWVPEGVEIGIDDAAFTELNLTFHKASGITLCTKELLADSTPSAAEVVGKRLTQSLKRKLDSSFLGATTVNGPDGLGSLTGATKTYAGTTITDLDAFNTAIVKAEKLGAKITSFVMHPDVYLSLTRLRQQDGSNVGLLQPDPASPSGRAIAGVPLVTSPDAPADVIYAVPKEFVYTVVRSDVAVETDTSAFWTSDRIAVKASLRVAYGFPFAAAVGAILLADEDNS